MTDNLTPPPADAPLSEWALWHHRRGEADGSTWVTAARPGTKAAYLPNWNRDPFKTEREVERHWRRNPNDNPVLVPRPGCFWLDADHPDVLNEAEAANGTIGRTYTQRSLNGRLQLLLLGDVTSSGKVYFNEKLIGETRGAGAGQCVAAGSRGTTDPEKTGKPAEPGTWSIDDPSPPAEAPAWLLNLIKTGGPATHGEKRRDYGQSIEWDTLAARALVAEVERGERVKGYVGPFGDGERNHLTYVMFAEACNRMIHPDVMLEEVLGSGIHDGLDDTEVERCQRSVYHDGNVQGHYGEHVPAYWLPNHVFQAYVDGQPQGLRQEDPVAWKARCPHQLPTPVGENVAGVTAACRAKVINLLDANTWAELDIPPPDRLLGDFFTTTTRGFIAGQTGLGKTLVGIGMAIGMAAGVGFLHWPSARAARVLYIDGEMPAELIKDRVVKEQRRRDVTIPPGNLIIYGSDMDDAIAEAFPELGPMPPLNTPSGYAWMMKLADLLGDIDAVIFDNVMSLIAGVQREEEGWADAQPLVMALTKRKIGQLWLDHTGHDRSRQYGSSTKAWRMDFVGVMTAIVAKEREVAFALSFDAPSGKARRRTPDNWGEFDTQTVRLVNDRWATTSGKPEDKFGKVKPSRIPFYDALSALAKNRDGKVSLDEWIDECRRRSLIEARSHTEGGTRAAEANFYKAKSDLISAKWIEVLDGIAFDLKSYAPAFAPVPSSPSYRGTGTREHLPGTGLGTSGNSREQPGTSGNTPQFQGLGTAGNMGTVPGERITHSSWADDGPDDLIEPPPTVPDGYKDLGSYLLTLFKPVAPIKATRRRIST